MKGFHIQSTTVGGAEVISISVHLISPKKKDQKKLDITSYHLVIGKSDESTQVSIDMGKGKGKGFSRIAKLVTASARDQQASPQQVTILMTLMVVVTVMTMMAMVVVQKDKVLLR